MRTPILLVLFIAFAPAKAQTTPSSLRPDISVDHYMNVRSSAVRLESRPDQWSVVLPAHQRRAPVVIDDGMAPPHDSVVFTTEDHLLDDTYGMTFHDSDLFCDRESSHRKLDPRHRSPRSPAARRIALMDGGCLDRTLCMGW